jgi:hypothetical protein
MRQRLVMLDFVLGAASTGRNVGSNTVDKMIAKDSVEGVLQQRLFSLVLAPKSSLAQHIEKTQQSKNLHAVMDLLESKQWDDVMNTVIKHGYNDKSKTAVIGAIDAVLKPQVSE